MEGFFNVERGAILLAFGAPILMVFHRWIYPEAKVVFFMYSEQKIWILFVAVSKTVATSQSHLHDANHYVLHGCHWWLRGV